MQKSNARRSYGVLRPIGIEIEKCVRPMLRQKSGAHARLVLDWSDIVGETLARMTHPERVQFVRGQNTQAHLIIRAHPMMALEVQHRSQQILEKVNQYFGYALVDRLSIIQGHIDQTYQNPKSTQRADRPIPEEVQELISAIDNPTVRTRLENLYRMLS